MTAPTNGWMGLGFAESGTMADADIIVTGVKDGDVYLIVSNFDICILDG